MLFCFTYRFMHTPHSGTTTFGSNYNIAIEEDLRISPAFYSTMIEEIGMKHLMLLIYYLKREI